MNSRYQLQTSVNQGGVGMVWKAWDSRLQRAVAIKRCLEPGLRSDGGAVNPDLMREATILSSLQHPHIVSVYDVEPDGPEGPSVVMEYLNGKNLEQAVSEAAMTMTDFCRVAGQTLDALDNAHRLNLLHRDIKPANIQITWLADGNFLCKFVDFGLARFFQKPSRQTVRQDGTVMGSVYYMAPEQLNRLELDGRSDLYSLGCVFFYLLTMHRPFVGNTVQEVITAHLKGQHLPVRQFRPHLPVPLQRWVEWLMATHPDNRPSTAGHALKVLQRIQAGEHVEIPFPSPTVPVPEASPVPVPVQPARSLAPCRAGARIPGRKRLWRSPRLMAGVGAMSMLLLGLAARQYRPDSGSMAKSPPAAADPVPPGPPALPPGAKPLLRPLAIR